MKNYKKQTTFELLISSYKTLEISKNGGLKINPSEIFNDPNFKIKIQKINSILKHLN